MGIETGMLWGRHLASMEHHTSLMERILTAVEHIATGVEGMPQRLAQMRSVEPKPARSSLREWVSLTRTVAPCAIILTLILTRILAPQVFVDLINAAMRLK